MKSQTKKKPIKKLKTSKKKIESCEIEKVLDNPIEVIPEIKNGEKVKVQSEIIGEILTPRQEKFCQLYSTDSSCFGNGVTTYLEVYDIDTTKKGRYKTACAASSRLLSNVKVFNRINQLLELQGLNDEFADKQLLFLLSQHDDKSTKLGAYREYNKLKQRIIEKMEIKTKDETVDLTGWTPQQIADYIAGRNR